jgi:hypothetical protein
VRAWVVVAAALAGVGCAAGGRGGAIGASSSPTGGGAGPSIDAGIEGGVGVSPIPSDFRTSLTRVSAARFSSQGHAGGRWDVDVYANRAGAEALGGDHAPAPTGALLVEEHFEKGDAGPGPIMLMEKEAPGYDAPHGDWRYVVVGARGAVVKDGAVESCAECHGDAPRDHVFRVQRAQ